MLHLTSLTSLGLQFQSEKILGIIFTCLSCESDLPFIQDVRGNKSPFRPNPDADGGVHQTPSLQQESQLDHFHASGNSSTTGLCVAELRKYLNIKDFLTSTLQG
jgi:hypothetical protein